MSWEAVVDTISALALIFGAMMSLSAAIGLLRFPDLLSRIHAATKPQVLGLFLLLLGMALQLRQWEVLPVLLIAWIFQLLTAPVTAHMVGRSGYRTKHSRRKNLSQDDLDDVVEAATLEEERAHEDGR